jgi:hypothetical protein
MEESADAVRAPEMLDERWHVVVNRAMPRSQPEHPEVVESVLFVPVRENVLRRSRRKKQCLTAIRRRRIGNEVALVSVVLHRSDAGIVERGKEELVWSDLAQGRPELKVASQMSVEAQIIL